MDIFTVESLCVAVVMTLCAGLDRGRRDLKIRALMFFMTDRAGNTGLLVRLRV